MKSCDELPDDQNTFGSGLDSRLVEPVLTPNWLDTAGHEEGLFFCRWLQADELPAPLATRVVKLDWER